MRLKLDFFTQDVLTVAPALLGKLLCRQMPDGTVMRLRITETEAYRGEEDLGCHASRGKTERTRILYEEGGLCYIYLIYGMYWMLNVVTGRRGTPQAALIRGLEGYNGPGKLTRAILVDKTFNWESYAESGRIWFEDDGAVPFYTTGPRIGIDYAGEPWKSIPWRFTVQEGEKNGK